MTTVLLSISTLRWNWCRGSSISSSVLLELIGIPSRVGLRAGHIGHPVAPDGDVVALDLLADLDQTVVEELQRSRGLDPEHARKTHALLHAHLDGVHAHQPHHLLCAGRLGD